MNVLDRFYPKDKLIQRTMNIEDSIYSKLEYLSNKKYDVSVSKLINACVDDLIEKENINIYEHTNDELLVKRTITFRKYSLEGLEKLRDKYKISIFRLVNIAIHNIVDDIEIKE